MLYPNPFSYITFTKTKAYFYITGSNHMYLIIFIRQMVTPRKMCTVELEVSNEQVTNV